MFLQLCQEALVIGLHRFHCFQHLDHIDIFFLRDLDSAKTSVKTADRGKTFASTNVLSFPCAVARSFDDLIFGMVYFRC